jgi:hypothetical protein
MQDSGVARDIEDRVLVPGIVSFRSIRHSTACAGVTGCPSVIDQRFASSSIDFDGAP